MIIDNINATTPAVVPPSKFEYKLIATMDINGIFELQKLNLNCHAAVIMTTIDPPIDPPGGINNRIEPKDRVFYEIGRGDCKFRKKENTMEFVTYEFHSGTTKEAVSHSLENDPLLKAVTEHCLHYSVFSIAAGNGDELRK